MSIELNRSAFEAFAQRNEFGTYRTDRKGDGYDSSHTQLMWMAWCAAIQQAEAKTDVPDDVVEILRAIHRRPTEAGIWLDDITHILRKFDAAMLAAKEK